MNNYQRILIAVCFCFFVFLNQLCPIYPLAAASLVPWRQSTAVNGSQVIIAHADLLDSNTQYFVDDSVRPLYENSVSSLYEDP